MIVLDEPTWRGEVQIAVLTNLPADRADAATVARLHRRPWETNTMFGQLRGTHRGKIAGRGQSQAAVFAVCVALLAFNIQNTIQAAVRSEHGAEARQKISVSDLVEEVSAAHRGMRVAIPKNPCTEIEGYSAETMSQLLCASAARIRLSYSRKQPRGPKKPFPARSSGAKIKHVATSKRLKAQKE